MRLPAFCFLLLLSLTSVAQSQAPDPRYRLIGSNNSVQSKNYYLLTLFQEINAVRDLLQSDSVLASIAKGKLDAVRARLAANEPNALRFTSTLLLSPEEVARVSRRLHELYQSTNALPNLVKDHLLPSGTYIRYANLSAEDLLVKAWEQDAYGINFTIGVYAEGKKPNYPAIDSTSFPVIDQRYAAAVRTALYEVVQSTADDRLFFMPSLNTALRFLEYNERNNAGDYEPMTETVNKAAFKRIKKLDFTRYPYSLILVPGAGPEDPKVALSAEAMMRMRIAAQQYAKGMAPFILVSGGRVHPYKTVYCEAVEMKNYLIGTLHIPEHAILLDPHARHTTTNLRNTARIIFRYGIPFDKPVLTSTARGQSLMISNTLVARCQKELGIAPFRVGKRLSETEVEIYPLIDALQIDPEEPMDP